MCGFIFSVASHLKGSSAFVCRSHQGSMQAVFDIDKAILDTLILACPNWILIENKSNW